MVTKKNTTGDPEEKKGRVKLNKLQLNKETVRDLTDSEAKRIKGGADALGVTQCAKSRAKPSATCDVGCAMG